MRAFTILLFCLGVAILSGCGSGNGQSDLTGEVTLDGKPIEVGSIMLVPVDLSKGNSTGGEIKNGKYSLTGPQAPLVGNYKVEISTNKNSGKKVQKSMGKPGELEDLLVEAVAPRFNKNTELKVDVKPGGMTANFTTLSK